MFELNLRDSRPIYQQLKERLRNLIIAGDIGEGEQLPSVREMAARMAINPNTIQRAYRELEHEGYVYGVPGKGWFAARKITAHEDRITTLWETLEQAAQELRFLGVSQEALMEHIKGGEQDD